jgi:hypothetical protein
MFLALIREAELLWLPNEFLFILHLIVFSLARKISWGSLQVSKSCCLWTILLTQSSDHDDLFVDAKSKATINNFLYKS